MTPRTAGFNSLDYGVMALPTLFLTILLMFIGANPGSTGGGIKTSTFFVMMAGAWSMVRGRREMVMFGRRIPQDTALRAMTVGLLSLGIVNAGILALVITNTNRDLLFIQLMFEAVSAFGTTGLSMNATGLLNSTQELILIALMYLGRIGPLTFAVAFATSRSARPVRYPEDPDILIG
ncbi:potassium transporter TrkG [Deinococcus lacus]|uniref:Potassium transporter TrkG n=1 Tax=Deinococcus lacus TaxID=392561 RepID=A0ABW1YEG7_9DEIO